jgi:hypothetical protein
MRIDPVHIAPAGLQAVTASTITKSRPSPQTAPESVAPQHEREVSVSMSDNRPVFRFVDKNTGDLIIQVPPEELLRVMRNIGELLRESNQKFKTAL